MRFKLDENLPQALADIRQYPVGTHAGLVVFRLRDQRWAALEGPARQVVDSGVLDRLCRGLAIVDEVRIRVRPGPFAGGS